MIFPTDSVIKYSSIALTSCCSGVGACFLTTHEEEEEMRYVQLTTEIKKELTNDLKQNIHEQTVDCINKERERLEPILYNNGWGYAGSTEDYTPRYRNCVDDIQLGDVLQGLFTKGKDQLLPASVT